jgi:LiaI-LiaF-like transmembrane region/B-box zinc finger
MNCANHPETPAVAYCRDCGKPLCEVCRHEVDGTVYCQEHSPTAAWSAPPPPPPPPPMPTMETPYRAPEATPYTAPHLTQPSPATSQPGASPGLAFLLGFIPGVGAIYNGQYVKGLIHVVVMGVLISIVSNDQMSDNLQPLFGMMIAVWVFYMAFEAYHTAKRRQLGQPVDEFSSIVPRAGHPARFPLAPTVLIAVGVLFLLHNLNILRIGELIRYWPVALICLGAYMLYERLSGPPAPPREHGAPGAREAVDERH